jgi:hypothetical protein
MADNYDKLWLQSSWNQLATSRAAELIQSTGMALPCRVVAVSGSIVEVAFEVDSGNQTIPNVTLPKAESQWLRAPTQIGDFGLTVPSDTYLGGISGLGGGVASLAVQYGNLSTLVFVPVASSGFSASPDPNKAWVNGPAGAVLSNAARTSSVVVSDSAVTITVGGKIWTFGASGFTLSTGTVAETHQHGGVEAGSSDTGPPIA